MAGCGGSGNFTIRGTLDLGGQSTDAVLGDGDQRGATCRGQNGFDDIDAGTQLVIKDSSGKQVAIGTLGTGHLAAGIDDPALATCRFKFTITGVPSGGKLYTVSIGSRGGYTFKQSAASDLSLTLG